MKSKLLIWITIFIMALGTSCHRESNNKLLHEKGKSQTHALYLFQQIDSLDNLGEFNPIITKDYIAEAEKFAHTYPEDPISSEFLYKAGLMAMMVAKVSKNQNSKEMELYAQKALTIFDDIQKIYPEFNGIKECIFYKGVVYEDILDDYENAELFYRAFIARYPSDSSAVNFEFLGKSAEEIFAEFEQR